MSEMPFQTHTDSGLRGDYRHKRLDWTIDQEYSCYTEADHDRWRRLVERQWPMIEQYGIPNFLHYLNDLALTQAIPRFERINEIVQNATGFTVVAVPGLIPGDVFFSHLANRCFPATVWLRQEHEMDYLVEPDVFHDVFGHVPMLLNPVMADFMQAFGQLGCQSAALGYGEQLSRLYWYTVEFGLLMTDRGFRAFGAGIVSSFQETPYAITSPQCNRISFNLERVFRTRYRIDRLQQCYFVLDNLDTLLTSITQDFSTLAASLRTLSDIEATMLLPDDIVQSLQ